MHPCPRCGASLDEGRRFCGSCGAPATDPVDGLTQGAGFPTPAAPAPALPTPGANRGAVMLPGAMVAGRYRVVALVGRGGMGEVYRADDLKLGQTVALKFLPRFVGRRGDPETARLLDEVRIARQISHPNVCRVYDVGEADGRHFLTMEFIDGEDLASLLRRIGRVPPEKAVQLARQLCAGVAAAHDQGVLHRDLKPANVMIDGRGRARIADFGLATLREGIPPQEAMAGTPAYMAPEQLAGGEVTVRSDLYALGLVLYELFAGRPAFERAGSLAELRERRSGPPPTPSSHVEGLDPSVERAILRCLEPDPALRPSSALAVSAALPGGDPLAAALAAGETPSPEVVAAAPKEGSLRPGLAAAALVATLLLWSGAFALATWPLRYLSFERPPEALADRARELLARLGHVEKPVDRAWVYFSNDELSTRLRHQPPAGLIEAARSGSLPAVGFGYRESNDHLVPWQGSQVDWDDPPFSEPGERRLVMTTDGRLVFLQAVPAERTVQSAATATQWSTLLEAAGLQSTELVPTTPTATPESFADTRAAWLTRTTEPSALRLRVEAAALGGVPVFFDIDPEPPEEVAGPPAAATARARFMTLLLLALVGSVFVAARRNIMGARADRKGAFRIAAVVFALYVSGILGTSSHAPVLGEFSLLYRGTAWSLFAAAIVWVLYIALEPLLRRRSPASLVSWTRLLAGRARDPLVGRDLLLGALVGAALVTLDKLVAVWRWKTGLDPVPVPQGLWHLSGVAGVQVTAREALLTACILGMSLLASWQFFSWLLRSNARGAVALGLVLLLGHLLDAGVGVGAVTLFLLVSVALEVFACVRLGLLTAVTMLWTVQLAGSFPLWSDPSAWFFSESAMVFVLGALPALWGAWVASRGRATVVAALP